MTGQIYLEIRDLDSLMAFIDEAHRKGFLSQIETKDIRLGLREKSFPVRVPIDLDAVLRLAANPIVKKMFGKIMETTTMRYIRSAMETD